MMQISKIFRLVIAAIIIFNSMSAQAVAPEGNAAMLRLSFFFGNGDRPSEPWLGLNFSQHEEVAPWEREERESAESSVSFNLVAPEIAFVNQNDRRIISFGEQKDDRLMVGCEPEQEHHGNDNVALAVGSAVVIGTAIYLLTSETVVLKTGCFASNH